MDFAYLTEDFCEKCGNEGFTIQKTDRGTFVQKICECRTKEKVATLEEIQANLDKELPKDVLEKYVPSPYYQDNLFDIHKFHRQKTLPEELTDIRYQSYKTYLNELTGLFKSGGIPRKSYLIVAPSDFGKNTFVFSSIQILLKANKNPSEFLYIADLADNIREEGFNTITNLVKEHDILFLTLGATPRKRDIMLYIDILERANRYGKPVITTSRKHPYHLASYYPMLSEYYNLDESTGVVHKYDVAIVPSITADYMEEYDHWLASFSAPTQRNFSQQQPRQNYQQYQNHNNYVAPQDTMSVYERKQQILRGEGLK